tara:strand:- start:433 stop:948 length:516 start_codon:yes stop_codon:yes gene_type:complete
MYHCFVNREDVFIHESSFVDESAYIGNRTKVWINSQIREGVSIGEECVIGKDVYIDKGVLIGDRCKIQNGVSIYNGVEIGDDVFIGPGVVFTNDLYPRAFNHDWELTRTEVMKGSSIGANSTVICGNRIGEYSMVGAGSLVSVDVPDFSLVVGNPSKVVGKVDLDGKPYVD